jgi:Tol biopolymer transport system component
MGWSPDGRWLLFGSARGGTPGLWGQAIVDGTVQGQPRLIKPDVGQISLGVSAAGSLIVGSPVGGRDVYAASVDLETGHELSPATRAVDTFVGFNSQPVWSPDGRLLSYVSLRSPINRDRVLAIRSADTGQLIRELRPPMTYFQTPRWTTDGQAVLATGSDLKGRQGVYRIDARTGEVTLVASGFPNANMFGPLLSSEGTKIYYRGFATETNEATLSERDLASGEERVLLRRGQVSVPSLSRDGRYLAVISSDGTTSSVAVISTADRRVRELAQGSAPRRFVNAAGWAPDGHGVVATRQQGTDGEPLELVFVPMDGGQPRRLETRLPPAVRGPIRTHPDGKRIAFEAGVQEREVWALDNFLPAATRH